MSRDETLRPGEADERAISDEWDALIAGKSDNEHAWAKEIDALLAMDSTPGLSAARETAIWESVQAATAVPVALNGHKAKAQRAAKRESRQDRLARLYRTLAIGLYSGFVAGVVAGGIGGRIAMRIAGSLSDGIARHVETQNGNTVGSNSVVGTLVLMVLAGFIGVAGGIVYLPFRSLLPGRTWQKGLLYGAVLLFCFGFVVMDKSNPDYRTFGSPAVNVGTFSLVYLLFGICIAPIASWFDRHLPTWPRERSLSLRNAPGHFAVLIGGALSCLALLLMGVAGLGMFTIIVLFAIAGALAARVYESRVRGIRPSWRHATPMVRYAILIGPMFVGIFLTLRSVWSILVDG